MHIVVLSQGLLSGIVGCYYYRCAHIPCLQCNRRVFWNQGFLVSLSFWKRLLIIVELKTNGNVYCISDISFEPLNIELIVSIYFAFRKLLRRIYGLEFIWTFLNFIVNWTWHSWFASGSIETWNVCSSWNKDTVFTRGVRVIYKFVLLIIK